MPSRPYNPDTDRRQREALLVRCRATHSRKRPVRFHSKRLAWLAVVRATYLGKRLADIALSAALLAGLAPLLLLIALSIRLDSPGPVLSGQTRLGRWGGFFTLLTFRTTRTDPGTGTVKLAVQNLLAGHLTFTLNPQPTRVGKLLRRTSLDRLPQLWNVLRGDLSLLGPRPARPLEVDAHSAADRRRLAVIPGMIRLARPAPRSTPPGEPARLDAQYLVSQSRRTDIQLLLQAIPAILLGRDAYD